MKSSISLIICLFILIPSSLAIPAVTPAPVATRTSNTPHIVTTTMTTTRTSTYFYTNEPDSTVIVICDLPVSLTTTSTTIVSGHSSYSTTTLNPDPYTFQGPCGPQAITEIDIYYLPYASATTTFGLISSTGLRTGVNGSVTEVVYIPTTASGTKVVYQTSGLVDFTSTIGGKDGSATIIVNSGSTSTFTMVVTEDAYVQIKTTYATSTTSISTVRPGLTSKSSISSAKPTSTSSKSSTTSSKPSTTLPVVSSTPSQSMPSSDDINMLQLGLFLGYLEGTLYQAGIGKYNEQQFEMAGFARPFRDNIALIAQQDYATTQAIKDILSKAGATPSLNCTFQFNLTSPQAFIGLGNTVTSISLSAYIGSSAILRDNSYLITVAASLLATKARHSAYIRIGLGNNPFPNYFDTSLPPSLAYNLAQPYVVSCPQKLNYPIYPKLILTSPVYKNNMPPKTPLRAGTNLTFAYDATQDSLPQKATYIALLNSNSNVVYVPAQSCGVGCVSILTTPNLGGIVYAVLTHLVGVDLPELTRGGIVAGPCVVLIS